MAAEQQPTHHISPANSDVQPDVPSEVKDVHQESSIPKEIFTQPHALTSGDILFSTPLMISEEEFSASAIGQWVLSLTPSFPDDSSRRQKLSAHPDAADRASNTGRELIKTEERLENKFIATYLYPVFTRATKGVGSETGEVLSIDSYKKQIDLRAQVFGSKERAGKTIVDMLYEYAEAIMCQAEEMYYNRELNLDMLSKDFLYMRELTQDEEDRLKQLEKERGLATRLADILHMRLALAPMGAHDVDSVIYRAEFALETAFRLQQKHKPQHESTS